MSSSREDVFPLLHLKKLVKDISDHNPLMINSGHLLDKTPYFRFHISLLKNEKILPIVHEI